MNHRYPILCALLCVAAGLLFPSCQQSRFIWYNFADIRDYKKFPSRPLHTDTSAAFRFSTAVAGKAPKSLTDRHDKTHSFEQYLDNSKTVAFLIIQRDTIQYEHYFRGYDRSSIVPSFSMAKSVTSLLVGCAIDDGLIRSVDEPVKKYLPDLKDVSDAVTIKHLLQMTSGIRFNESYFNPFGHAAAFYYGRNLRRKALRLKSTKEPGVHFAYTSGNTQLLGLVLERAIQPKTITSYLEEKVWRPLGMEYDASWSIDMKKNGVEKTFCCLNARARDFAKIGRLYLDGGKWNGQQIVSPDWVKTSTSIDSSAGSAAFYQYQWWLPSPNGDFMAQGFLGQYIYVQPEKSLIIVRLGKQEGDVDWSQVFRSLAEAY